MIGLGPIDAVMAHAGSGRSDLPLEPGLAAWGAGVAVAMSFAALGVFWQRARLRRAAVGIGAGVPAERLLGLLAVVGRVVGVVAFFTAIGSAIWGLDNPANSFIHPLVFGVVWVVMQAASAVLGDVWRALNPLDTFVVLLRRMFGRPVSSIADIEADTDPDSAGLTVWPAVVGAAGFLWIELAYHGNDSIRFVGWILAIYSLVMVAGGVARGRSWLRHSDFLSVLFGSLAHLSPFFRNDEGRLRMRVPFSGLATMNVPPGLLAFFLVVLGGTTYDGLSGSPWWNLDVVPTLAGGTVPVGWGATAVSTVGLLWCIATVSVAYLLACWSLERGQRFAPSLVPIILGYAVAHYFSFAYEKIQHLLFGLSDPFNLGWDLLGNEQQASANLLSVDLISWVQVGAIVVGHVGAVLVAHDMAVEDEPGPRSIVSELPLAALMIGYTGLGLWLLMNT